jgi:hypothetical protein
MTAIAAALVWPETVGAWVGAILGLVLIVSALGGVMIGLGRNHIASAVARSVHTEVPAVVALALREVNAKLDGIRINQAELSNEVGIVRRLEAKIENGLSSKVNSIEERQTVLVTQVAEMHGWMQATHQYDGTDRRDG